MSKLFLSLGNFLLCLKLYLVIKLCHWYAILAAYQWHYAILAAHFINI